MSTTHSVADMSMFTYSGSPLTTFERPRRKRLPVSLTLLSRMFLGLVFIVAGLNGHFGFMKSFDVGGQFQQFAQAMSGTWYHDLVMILQALGGLCLLSRYLINLGLFILGPIGVQIFFFHLHVRPDGLWLATPMLLAIIYLAWKNRQTWLTVLFSKGVA